MGDKTERAYAHGDLFTRRARLMADWADFFGKAPGKVVALSNRVSVVASA